MKDSGCEYCGGDYKLAMIVAGIPLVVIFLIKVAIPRVKKNHRVAEIFDVISKVFHVPYLLEISSF